MADAVVASMLDRLRQLLLYREHLIKDAKSPVEMVERNLLLFKAFLNDSAMKRRREDSLRELVRQIWDVVYEADDVIDALVTQTTEIKSRNYFVRALQPSQVNLVAIAKRLEEVGDRVRAMCDGVKGNFDSSTLSLSDGESEEKEVGVIREKQVMGFEEETSEVIGYLNEPSEKLDVITLLGMPGIGKTTLAWKIYNHPEIMSRFPIRIWVHVSNGFTKRNVFRTILRQLTMNSEEDAIHDKSDDDDTQLVISHLNSSKEFLMVLDDVWSVSDWDRLGFGVMLKYGKVLITTCNEEVGMRANRYRRHHKVRLLNESESWELFQLEVFGAADCPPQLATLGKLMTKQCNGLPLAIITVGQNLARLNLSCGGDLKAMRSAWTEATINLPNDRSKKFYDNLPSQLQLCFLYLAVFPYDYEIPVGRLISMWIAEGFVMESNDQTLEETAETYLENLIHRSLVEARQVKYNGRVKTCSIHRMLHDFCKAQAGSKGENFLTEIEFVNGNFEPPVYKISNCRRISIHSDVSRFLSSKPFAPYARSFISFSSDEILLSENVTTIPAGFKLLRVLDVKPLPFARIPADMYRLLHLRHLALSLNSLRVLPRAISKFSNIQTLLVDTTHHTLEVKADILGFTQLRHFKSNASTTFGRPSKTSGGGEKLQTLGMIAPESCTEELFSKARNLKKLGIRGRLALLVEGKIGSFHSLRSLRCLEKLKLLNDVFPMPAAYGKLYNLPPHNQFPPTLKSLTLTDTFLEWVQMSIIGLLEKLEVLKLKDNAFKGTHWEANDGGFKNLEALHIERTDLVIWVASARHFPCLRSLKLKHCEKLQEVPIELADLKSLQKLELFETILAAPSAKRFEEKKKKLNHEFRLKTYP